MARRELTLVLAAGLLSACRDTDPLRELSGPARLGATPLVLRPEPALAVTPGATHELCLAFADSGAREEFSTVGPIEQAVGSPMRTREGQVVRITARFTTESGAVESVVPGGWQLARPVTRVWFRPRTEQGAIREVAIEADGPIRTERITWFDGVRRPITP